MSKIKPPYLWCSGCGKKMAEGEPNHKNTDPGHSGYRPERARLLREWNAEAERLARWVHDREHAATGSWENAGIIHRSHDMDATRTFLGRPPLAAAPPSSDAG